MVFALVLLHVAAALVAPPIARRIGTRVLLVVALAPGAALAWALAKASSILDGDPVTQVVSWVPELGLDAAFRVDAFSLLMVFVVSGIGVAVFVYAAGYMEDDERLPRFTVALTLFGGSMLGLVTADNLLVLYVFWEGTSVTSYLLIGHDEDESEARAAARHALIVTAAGGFAMLAGFVVIGREAGTFLLSEIVAQPPGGLAAGVGFGLILAGVFTKSAQVPFHGWLPRAMAAPTPVSAYLHAATMVKAGVYLLARIAPVAAAFGYWRPLVVIVGGVTMVWGGARAVREQDLKLLLAHGTVSQLGFMTVLVGLGIPELTYAGVGLIVAHALFKGSLFLVVGIVDHHAHTRLIPELEGVRAELPGMAVVAVLAAASMAGLPPLLGFVAKETALGGLLHAHGWVVDAGFWFVVVGSVLTAAYSWRFVVGGFGGSTERGRDRAPTGGLLAVPAATGAAFSLALGALPFVVDELVHPAAVSLDPRAGEFHLELWHGFTTALGVSAAILVVGFAMAAVPAVIRRIEGLRSPVPAAARLFDGLLAGLDRVADVVTGSLQTGSLPFYLGVILLFFVVVPGAALLGADVDSLELLRAPAVMTAVCVVVVIAALSAAAIQRRFAAAIALGATGYGVAVLFVIHGAPDLALTQLLVETVTLVVFVLVLRHLPERFRATNFPARRAARIGIATATGAFVAVAALVAASVRSAPPVSQAHLDLALPEAKGRNVVNVILTDFRALDTMGETLVLTVAAFGVASLVLVRRTRGES